MAKNDYYTIAAKILIYLYKKYQHKEGLDPNYITPMTKDFPISIEQLYDTIDMLNEQGYIKAHVIKIMGGEIQDVNMETMRILPAGIDYMLENRGIRKALNGIKEAFGVISQLKRS